MLRRQLSPFPVIEADGSFSQAQSFGGTKPDITNRHGWLLPESGRGCAKTERRFLVSVRRGRPVAGWLDRHGAGVEER